MGISLVCPYNCDQDSIKFKTNIYKVDCVCPHCISKAKAQCIEVLEKFNKQLQEIIEKEAKLEQEIKG